tara:strand:- start:785 stop:1057 length:273 start_codon:yes stop_codon:yes gene_type:complete
VTPPASLTTLWFRVMLDQENLSHEEEKIQYRIMRLCPSFRHEYYTAYQKKMKDADTYAVLNWFFIGGLHHFYLGQVFRGAINFSVMIIGF